MPYNLTPEQDLKVSPQQLIDRLLNTSGNLEELLDDLQCTPDDIAETLADQATLNHLKLRADLATFQARLQAAQFLPACTGKLLRLTDAEKPEVARRAIMAVYGMAGVPTRTSPIPSNATAIPLTPAPEPELKPRGHSETIAEQQIRLKEEAKDGNQAERLRTLDFYRSVLVEDYGIDLAKLTDLQFEGFAQHIQDFFLRLDIEFRYRYAEPPPWENSIDNPQAIQRAREILAQSSPQTHPLSGVGTIDAAISTKTIPPTPNATPTSPPHTNQNPAITAQSSPITPPNIPPSPNTTNSSPPQQNSP